MRKLRWLILAAVLVTAMFVVAGCGDSAETTTTAGGTETTAGGGTETTAGTDTTAAGGPQRGGVLVVNSSETAARFGFPATVIHGDQWYQAQFQQGLLRPTAEVGVYEPVLATSWDLAPDKLSYTFHLREGVKFHDGTDFNADAVKFCWDMLIGKDPTFAQVSSVEVVDPLTLKVNLKQFDNQILPNLGRGAGFVFSPTAFQENGEEYMYTHPVGTGPWILKEFTMNQPMILEKNPDYWDKDYPYLDGVEITQILDANTALAALRAGEVDALNNVDPISAADLQKEGKYDLQSFYGPTIMLEMNTTDPNSVWTDIRMRQALEYAIDKESICQTVGLGFLVPSYEICKGIHDITDPGTTPRTYDLAKAKQLIADAGHADGMTVTLTYDSNRTPPDMIAALQASLGEIGITLEPEGLAGPAFNQASFEPPAGNGLRLEGQRGGSPNVLNGVNETLSEQTIFFPGIKRPDGWTPWLNEALAKEDLNDATPILVEMEKAAYDDVMMVPLWINLFVSAYDSSTLNNMDFFYANAPNARFDLAWLSQ